ncbi:GlxA family transcriptional regulator [Arenicella xantha]|uniref:AraC family transcriptional regulator with amidase-like domain n=1 Tax=Arenicella xantha TaxID=644221 RepID=A0A395JN83_9GAMM|nr:helix-turn-helix domain-containing protein [Arenicella xantha]RBP53120.1 AraC family transcriptional regulator with amidase-like domain [Arenicella xantha]
MNTIVILCLNNALPSGLMGIKDLLALSGLHFVQQGTHRTTNESAWEPKVILANQDGDSIIDGHGRSFDVDSDLDAIHQCDAVLVPGFIPNAEGCPPTPITDSLTQSWLAARHKQGALVCGSCSGVFALGEAGILNNKRCTTTWWLHDELKQRFPRANAIWASALVDDAKVVTAGGPLSWVDITLHIVEKLAGAETARITADFAVVDTIPKSQALYVPEGYQTSKNTFLSNAEYAIRKAYYKPMSAGDLAGIMSVSERTLNRKLKELTGQTPKSFIDGIRIRHACTLLITSNKSVKEIAYSLGYSDDSVFRRLFKREMKMTPSSYQQLKTVS